MCERRPGLLLADDHPLMVDGLRKLLELDFDVVGTVSDGRALLEAAESLRPDLVITDISMPGIDGIEATRRLRAIVPGLRVVILSVHAEPSWVHAAFAAGAYGYLTKMAAAEEIETAVREVLKGNFYVSPAVASALVGLMQIAPVQRAERSEAAQPERPAAGETLTPRELDIVRLVGKGLGNKDIARQLGVAVTTVRTHLNKVYDKLDSGSRLELALYAAQTREAVM
jgi:DNA-binding NarL/FixJ family response regulator